MNFDRSTQSLLVLASLLILPLACDEDKFFDSQISGQTQPAAVREDKSERQRAVVDALFSSDVDTKQILFGDLHVHSSYSWDGFLFTLPMVGGEGAHPPADVCDFARYCSNLDFYALTDHAETLLPKNWAASKESVRECNARAGDLDNPDLVAYMGFEWSQAGLTPQTHWGHRNVIFPSTGDDQLPARPIGAGPKPELFSGLRDAIHSARLIQPSGWGRYSAYSDFLGEVIGWEPCEAGVDSRALPVTCQEFAADPMTLHEKLDQWGFDVLEIPHGMAWGTYTPAGSDISKHLDPAQFDPDKQILLEVMSGHGNSEQYQSFREFELAEDGSRICPAPTEGYLACCWQAGEIMRTRCGDLSSEDCEDRVVKARQYAVDTDVRPNRVFPDAAPEEWLDCGQCRDCLKPSFAYRPQETAQYAMALAKPTADPDAKLRFRYGFVGSSDGHTGRPGTGYKQLERGMMTDAVGRPDARLEDLGELANRMDDPQMPFQPSRGAIGVQGTDNRVQSFLYPGGLAAVHSKDRSRESIWQAMKRREVYGTTGPRMLLWFDLLNGGPEPLPMGSELQMKKNPRFQVRAAGSFKQKPGCPDWAQDGLPADRLTRLCRDECYNPSDDRRAISAIEVVRIRPQQTVDESVDLLIEDPWLRHECEPNPNGCVFTFEDTEFIEAGRDVLYYARAVEETSMALNGDPLFTEFDEAGNAVNVKLCRGDFGQDGCPAPVQENAWSSPIFVDQLTEVAEQ